VASRYEQHADSPWFFSGNRLKQVAEEYSKIAWFVVSGFFDNAASYNSEPTQKDDLP